jgi:hypothetical protein
LWLTLNIGIGIEDRLRIALPALSWCGISRESVALRCTGGGILINGNGARYLGRIGVEGRSIVLPVLILLCGGVHIVPSLSIGRVKRVVEDEICHKESFLSWFTSEERNA